MVKPTDSTSPHRPLHKASVGRVLNLEATIIDAGHVTSTIRIGALNVKIGNANLRHASGKSDL